MAISAEEARKAIQKVYPTLLKLLPISELVEHFYSRQLLSYERKSKFDSLTSLKEKVAYFLDEMLIPGLSINYTKHFDEMVAVMKESHDDLTRFLVEKLTLTDHKPIDTATPSIASATTVTTDTGNKYMNACMLIKNRWKYIFYVICKVEQNYLPLKAINSHYT